MLREFEEKLLVLYSMPSNWSYAVDPSLHEVNVSLALND